MLYHKAFDSKDHGRAEFFCRYRAGLAQPTEMADKAVPDARLCPTILVNCEDRGLARFVDTSIEMQFESDKTVTTATMTATQ